MALEVEPTRLITVEGNGRPVESLPQEARELLVYYDEYRRRARVARADLLEAQLAMGQLENEIARIVAQADEEKAKAEAEQEGSGQDAEDVVKAEPAEADA